MESPSIIKIFLVSVQKKANSLPQSLLAAGLLPQYIGTLAAVLLPLREANPCSNGSQPAFRGFDSAEKRGLLPPGNLKNRPFVSDVTADTNVSEHGSNKHFIVY